jgi:hypothetical protein
MAVLLRAAVGETEACKSLAESALVRQRALGL